MEEMAITNPNYELRITEDSRNAIFAAARAINSVCDGAKKKDFVGFSKPDAQYFKPRMNYKYVVSDFIIDKMYAKLEKYSKQLEGFNIKYEDLKPKYETALTCDIHPRCNIRLKFGKYYGKTMREVVAEDEGYVRWIARKYNGSDYVKFAAITALEEIDVVVKIPKVMHLRPLQDYTY